MPGLQLIIDFVTPEEEQASPHAPELSRGMQIRQGIYVCGESEKAKKSSAPVPCSCFLGNLSVCPRLPSTQTYPHVAIKPPHS